MYKRHFVTKFVRVVRQLHAAGDPGTITERIFVSVHRLLNVETQRIAVGRTISTLLCGLNRPFVMSIRMPADDKGLKEIAVACLHVLLGKSHDLRRA